MRGAITSFFPCVAKLWHHAWFRSRRAGEGIGTQRRYACGDETSSFSGLAKLWHRCSGASQCFGDRLPSGRGEPRAVTELRFARVWRSCGTKTFRRWPTSRSSATSQNRNREKIQDPNVTKLMRGRGALRGESWCHGAARLPFPPTVPRRRPGPPAAAGRVPRPLSRGPPSAAPLAARPRPAPAAPCAARRGPGASRAGSIPARRSPPGERMKKTPCPGEGQGAGIDVGMDRETTPPSRPALRHPWPSQTPPTA